MTTPAKKCLMHLGERITRPPFSRDASGEAGHLLYLIQLGVPLGMPQSRPMPSVGSRVHELRIRDAGENWRILYRPDSDYVVVIHIFNKKTRQTLKHVIELCQRHLASYDEGRT